MELNLEGIERVSTAVVTPAWMIWGFIIGALVVLLGGIVGSVLLVGRWSRTGGAHSLRLWELPAPLRLLVLLSTAGFMLVQAFGATDAYVQTNLVNTDVGSYFDYVSWPRLLGMTHAHMFGFIVMYGVLSVSLCLTEASDRVKAILISTMLWCSLFDVIAWWGIKYLASSKVEILAIVTGSSAAIATLTTVFLIIRTVFWGGEGDGVANQS